MKWDFLVAAREEVLSAQTRHERMPVRAFFKSNETRNNLLRKLQAPAYLEQIRRNCSTAIRQYIDTNRRAGPLEDGYQAQRSYSIASAPEAAQMMLTVERIDDGEISVSHPGCADQRPVRTARPDRRPFRLDVCDGRPAASGRRRLWNRIVNVDAAASRCRREPGTGPHCCIPPAAPKAATTLAGLGHDRSLIKTERFGPNG